VTTYLPVSEVFGPTWQGEGPHTGLRTGFVRLGLCNLTCEWCDTPYTWDRTRYDLDKEAPSTAIPEVHQRLRALGVEHVCLSGGEPLMHRQHLEELLVPEWSWHVETNGTIAPPSYWLRHVEHTTVSPKINTRDPRKKRIKLPALEAWNGAARQGRAAFKFVARTPADLGAVAEVVQDVGIDAAHVWVMPEGTSAHQVLHTHRLLAPHIEERGWNTTTRLHVLLYGPERGR
jgi:organic radical activating enzyme